MRIRGAAALAVALCASLALVSCREEAPEAGADGGNTPAEFHGRGIPTNWGQTVPGATVAGEEIAEGVETFSVLPTQPIVSSTLVLEVPSGGSQGISTGAINALDVTLSNQLPVGTPAILGNRVYVGSGFGSYLVNCLDATTGAIIWSKPSNSDGPSAIAAEGNYISFTTESCTLEVMDADTGALLWGRWLGDPVPAAPTLAGNRVLAVYPNWSSTTVNENLAGPVPVGQVAFGNPGGVTGPVALGCFDTSDGTYLWGAPLPAHVIYAPIVHGDRVYCTTLNGDLVQVDLLTGTVLSNTNVGATSPPTAYVDGSTVKLAFSQRYIDTTTHERLRTGTAAGVLDAALIAPGTATYLDTVVSAASNYFVNPPVALETEYSPWLMPSWSAGTYPSVGVGSVFAMSSFEGSRPVVANNRIYAAMGNRVVATDMQGNVAWNYNHPTTNGWRLLNPPALAGNKLVVSDMEGKVVVLNADTGAVLNTYVTNFHFTQQPAVMNGGIYLGTSNGHLIMIPTGDLSMTGWSQWGGNSRHNK